MRAYLAGGRGGAAAGTTRSPWDAPKCFLRGTAPSLQEAAQKSEERRARSCTHCRRGGWTTRPTLPRPFLCLALEQTGPPQDLN